jgi:hypothetical protein
LQGTLTSLSPQTGKFTIRYDDGQGEAVLLERERFLWHSPRAASAGYKPALHSLMQQLGADGIGKLPVTGEDGKVVPETAGPEVGVATRHVFPVCGCGVWEDKLTFSCSFWE